MKRANGTGSVEVLRDGRARIRAVIDGKRKQLGPLYPDADSARRVLKAWNAERGEGEILAGSELTLATYGSEWLDRREINGSRRREQVRSIAGERSVWRRHVAASDLAALPLTAIRPRDVEAFALELRGRKATQAITKGTGPSRVTEHRETGRTLSRAMQREAIRLVRSVLDAAVRAELLERNPADGVEVAKGSARPRDLSEDWLRWPEVRALVDCEKLSERDRRAFACAIGLALRLSDLKGIEVARVELDCRVPGPGITVWVEKIQRWHRVPVMPWLVPVVREQLESLPRGARYLFPREDGKRYGGSYDFGWGEDRETGRATVPAALAKAGVSRRIRFHDLRGTCATHLALGTWGRSWSLHEIQAMLAHSDQRVTERYVRRAVDMLAAAAAATPGCPALPMGPGGGSAESATFLGAPGPGLEPGTIRLTAPGPSKRSRRVSPHRGQPVGNRAAALAREVLDLAQQGSPHALRRALELAEAVLLEHAEAVDERTA